MRNVFYTYSDINYLCRALALYNSMVFYNEESVLYFLCLDKTTYDVLKNAKLSRIHLIFIQELLIHDAKLSEAKNNRSKLEFYFTCTASFGRYLFNHFEDIQFLTYLDADTYFYSSPDLILKKLENSSIGITPHRFPISKKQSEKYGIYNVGWVSFKRDVDGLACLEKWREECLEWCGNYLDENKFGDQKYLDNWPKLYKKVNIIEHNGVNAAPWNLEGATISLQGEQVFINNDPLILYHFHSLSRLFWQIYKLGLYDYSVCKNKIIWQKIYLPYIKEVNAVYNELQEKALPLHGILTKSFSLRNFLRSSDLLLNCGG